jgi:hypothetical protein
MTPQERAALWEKLGAAGFVAGELPAADAQRTPWYVRLMLGIAGWIGALFLFGFVGVGFALVMKSGAVALLVGAAVCGGAAVLLRAGPANDFVSQLGLAVSLAGQVLMAYGFGDLLGFTRVTLPLVLAVQQAVLFWLVPNFIHRVWAAWTGAFAITFAMAQLGYAALAPAAVSAAFVVVWLREFDLDRRGALLRAGGYGLALATLQTCILFGPLWVLWLDGSKAATTQGEGIRGWIGAIAAGAVLVAAALMLLRREGLALTSPQGRVALIGAVMLALVSLKASALGPAVAVLVVGYANGNRVLAGLGLLSLIGYLSHYYYAMQVTLLEKSALLAAAGVALVVLRFALRHWWPAGRGAHA